MLRQISKYIKSALFAVMIASPAFTACCEYDYDDVESMIIYDLAYPEDPTVVFAADAQKLDGSIVISNKNHNDYDSYDDDVVAENNANNNTNAETNTSSSNYNAPEADLDYEEDFED